MSEKAGKKKKLLLIGPYPKPYGGVSIHLKRLVELLDEDFRILKMDESRTRKSDIFNLRSLQIIKYASMFKSTDVIHIHSGHYILRLTHFLTSKVFGKKMIVTMHAYEEKDKSPIEKRIDRLIFRNTFRVICVSQEIAGKFALSNSFVKEAFIPPVLEDEPLLPDDLMTWISARKHEGHLICCGNASRLDLSNKEDLYGLDLFIDAARHCYENRIKIAFVFVVGDTTGPLQIATYKKLIDSYGLSAIFFLYEGSLSFVRLISESDMVLRPTNTDGDALTVREALFYDKKVIASDVATRPEGTQLFESRNLRSLIAALLCVYDDLKNPNITISSGMEPPKVSEYRDFYKKILEA